MKKSQHLGGNVYLHDNGTISGDSAGITPAGGAILIQHIEAQIVRVKREIALYGDNGGNLSKALDAFELALSAAYMAGYDD